MTLDIARVPSFVQIHGGIHSLEQGYLVYAKNEKKPLSIVSGRSVEVIIHTAVKGCPNCEEAGPFRKSSRVRYTSKEIHLKAYCSRESPVACSL